MLGNLLLTDKVTNEKLRRCSAVRATRSDANIGNGAPRVAVGEAALVDFHARVILNSNAKLNLGELATPPTAGPRQAQVPIRGLAPALRTEHRKAAASCRGGTGEIHDWRTSAMSGSLDDPQFSVGARSTCTERRDPEDSSVHSNYRPQSCVEVSGGYPAVFRIELNMAHN